MNEDFKIPLNGKGGRKHVFSRHLSKEFFEEFGCSDIIDADVDADFFLEKSGGFIGIDCTLEGSVTVPCDRCSEPLELPLSRNVKLSVKFGDGPSAEDVSSGEEERETVYLPEGEIVMDMAQTVYDYCMLSIPLKKTHPEGKCNPAVMKYLVSEMPDEDSTSAVRDADDNPFSVLKGLFDN